MPESPMISDAPKDWKDMITDPGMVTIFGFIALLLGLLLMVIVPGISAIYAYFAGAVVGLVGGHSYTDSQKIKFMCSKKEDQ